MLKRFVTSAKNRQIVLDLLNSFAYDTNLLADKDLMIQTIAVNLLLAFCEDIKLRAYQGNEIPCTVANLNDTSCKLLRFKVF